MSESIFFSSIRAFFVAFFAIMGICVGIIPVIILIASLVDTSTTELESTYTQEVVANAEGKRKTVSKEAPVILKVNISGIIGTESLNASGIRQLLMESREGALENDRVKAILLYVNTPGGTVFDADGIYHAVKDYKERYKVPVYAYVDGLCASGGVYTACAADKIFASNISQIGSVGVISPSFLNFTQLIDKLGIQALTLSAGKDKDMLNPLRPWGPDEQKPLQNLIDYFYQYFVNIVVENRPQVDKDKLINVYGANIFNAIQAQEYGFINESGYSLESTLKALLKQVGILDDNYQVIEMQHKTWFTELFKTEWSLLKGKVTHHIQLTAELDSKLEGQFLYLYRPEK